MLIQRGSQAPEVRSIQERLKELNLYLGPIDSDFGGGTESAVKSFQRSRGLTVDGAVGPDTWSALFPGKPAPALKLLDEPVAHRCLALTGCFETGAGVPDCFCGVTGDFDHQGISFGVLQWNFGQGSLQPLLQEMISGHRDICESIFHEHLATLENVLTLSKDQQLAWTRSIQDPVRFRVFEPWRGMLRTLGRTPEYQAIQTHHADSTHRRAIAMCSDYGLTSERAVALMFDICVQNGSISKLVRSRIQADIQQLPPSGDPDTEVAKMRIIANRRAEVSVAKYVEDVRSRKLTIAEGKGVVHGIPYDLERQFGLRLTPFAAGAASGA